MAETSTLTYSGLDIWGVEPHVHDVIISGDYGSVGWQFDWDYDPTTKVSIPIVAFPVLDSRQR